jgi:hypothetical protein
MFQHAMHIGRGRAPLTRLMDIVLDVHKRSDEHLFILLSIFAVCSSFCPHQLRDPSYNKAYLAMILLRTWSDEDHLRNGVFDASDLGVEGQESSSEAGRWPVAGK